LFTTLKRVALPFAFALAAVGAIAQTPTTFAQLETIPGWNGCSTCAGGRGKAAFQMTEGVESPSLDGASAQFALTGGRPFSNALWWLHVTNSATAANFILDLQQYLDDAQAPQAIEYAVTQKVGRRWYKFSTQCSFQKGVWRVWDSRNRRWTDTSAPCTRPLPQTWQHLTFEYQRANGMALFVAITVDGQTFYLNKSFRPGPTGGSTGIITVHYQLDGNITQTRVNAYIDQLSLSIW
jgi:hypothetical protein